MLELAVRSIGTSSGELNRWLRPSGTRQYGCRNKFREATKTRILHRIAVSTQGEIHRIHIRRFVISTQGDSLFRSKTFRHSHTLTTCNGLKIARIAPISKILGRNRSRRPELFSKIFALLKNIHGDETFFRRTKKFRDGRTIKFDSVDEGSKMKGFY